MTEKGGRQWGKTLAEIQQDHVERYEAALHELRSRKLKTVADLGSGYGYGSWILAHECDVSSYDRWSDCLFEAADLWHHPRITRRCLDLENANPDSADMFVMFEVIEHFNSHDCLKRLYGRGKFLMGSVTNEEVEPFNHVVHRDHVRHYKPLELLSTLGKAGWTAIKLGSQSAKVGRGAKVDWTTTNGRTLVFLARGESK